MNGGGTGARRSHEGLRVFLRASVPLWFVLPALTTAPGCAPRPSIPSPAPPPAARRVERGRAIYQSGVSPSVQPIRARLVGGAADVPAAVLTCGNCHGRDGIGKAEGGITPPTITWDELTREYGPAHPSGRRRPAYDERSLGRAITMGFDPTGRPLDASMPRYLLTREDLDDLVLFLKVLGSDADPGLTDRAIVVGTILPPSSSLGELSRAVRSVLVAYFEEVNRRGGLYGRRLELRCAEAPEASEDRLGEARRFLGRRDTFALVAPFLAGAEDAVAEAARAENVPVVGPFTSSPKSGSPPNRYVFYLHSSLADQARALALFADGRLAGRKPSAILLFAEDDEEARSASQAVRAECLRLGWGRVEGPSRGPPDQPDRMKFDVAFVLSPGCREVEGLLAAGPTGRGPLVLIPGALAGKEVLGWASDVRDRLFLSFPTLPLDITPDGSAEYGRLAAAYKLPEGYRSSQIEALAAAKVLVEALTAAGRGVGRETLIDQLEHFYQRPTGLTRPITFGPNRRFGTRGAYIAGVAASRAKLVPVGGYIEPPLR